MAAFLKARRTRLKPEDVGLTPGARRRTPGLRREEVAALAEVSTEWYAWLEQARDVRASTEVLERIASALRLEPTATRHLLTLAGYGRSAGNQGGSEVHAHLQRMLDRLDPFPAWVYGERWDVIAWNKASTVLYGDFAAMTGLDRNMLCVLFLNPAMREMLIGWQGIARGIVAKIRTIHARFVGDPWYQEVIDRLCAESPDFAQWWNAHDVDGYQDGVKVFEHPRAGRLVFDFSVLDVRDERFAHLSMVTYIPQPGTGTLEKMQALVGA